MTNLLEIQGIEKRFGSHRVLRGIDLTIGEGEFVGLMGPNGAGKSTLIKILDGVYRADKGTVMLDGAAVPNLADRLDVGFIHQDLGLVDDLSISDNLRLGEPPIRRAGVMLDLQRERELAVAALERVSLERSPTTLVGDLSPGEKTLVAVARTLQHGARLLIIDEATSTLSSADSTRLIDALRETASEGTAVIMVSHKLSEILGATERVVVLLEGDIAVDEPRQGLDRQALASMLFSHEVAEVELPVAKGEPGDVVLSLSGAHGGRCGPVDLEVRAGQVIGITGLAGSGLHDLAYLAAGAIQPTRGKVEFGSKAPALIPPHRETQGGFGDLDVKTNMTIGALWRWRRAGWIDPGRERSEAAEMVARVEVEPPSTYPEFQTLSGGNKQKCIFGRVMFREADAYVLCEPTRGVDVKTRAALYRIILALRDEGAAILVVSSDTEDLFATCDLIGIVQAGRVSPLRKTEEIPPTELERLV